MSSPFSSSFRIHKIVTDLIGSVKKPTLYILKICFFLQYPPGVDILPELFLLLEEELEDMLAWQSTFLLEFTGTLPLAIDLFFPHNVEAVLVFEEGSCIAPIFDQISS